MDELRELDIHDVQDWIRTAPVSDVHELLWWAQGVLAIREEMQRGRKRRSDAGKPRKPKADQLTIGANQNE